MRVDATNVPDTAECTRAEPGFRTVANTASVLIWMSDANEEITYVNQPWLDNAGQRELAVDMRRAMASREPFQLEHRFGLGEGEYRWALTAGVPRYNANGSFAGYIGTSIDITERQLAERVLFRQQLIAAHEEESSRIARELHDDISQRLALVSMRLECLRQAVPASASATEFREEIGEASQQLADLGGDIHAVSHRLYPAKLELLGLEKAAAAFCQEWAKRHGVTIDVDFENVPTALPREISLSLFRVLQEALQNLVKHSGSRRAQVSLSSCADTIELTVKDSGVGFDLDEASRGPGIGMISMNERLKVVRGQLSIHSKRGNGTIIHAIAPLCLPSSTI
jgi:signal transduction histidine kinase